MNAGLNFQPVDDEESRDAAEGSRRNRVVTERELDVLRYTGALRGVPGCPDPNGPVGSGHGGGDE